MYKRSHNRTVVAIFLFFGDESIDSWQKQLVVSLVKGGWLDRKIEFTFTVFHQIPRTINLPVFALHLDFCNAEAQDCEFKSQEEVCPFLVHPAGGSFPDSCCNVQVAKVIPQFLLSKPFRLEQLSYHGLRLFADSRFSQLRVDDALLGPRGCSDRHA